MPAATNRADLISITEKEYTKLTTLLTKVDATIAKRPFEGGTSIKDVIGHRAHWTELFFGWYQQGQKTGVADIPAKGYKWNQLKEYNANLRQEQQGLSWDDVRQMLESSYGRLLDFIEQMDDQQLYGQPMQGGGKNGWTTGRFAEAAGASHYRSAAKYVRACLKKMAD